VANRGKKSALYGSVTTPQGDGTPVLVEHMPLGLHEKSGYDPAKLDPIIDTLIDNAASGARLLKTYTPALEALMRRLAQELNQRLDSLTAQQRPALPAPADGKAPIPPPLPSPDALEVVLDLASKVSVILERLNKMTMNSVGSKDQATRLRTFLATGDSDDGGLANMGENQLRRMVVRAAAGWTKAEPDEEDPQ
jgi:hypothetical protein